MADEETDEPLIADYRNFYNVEKWSRDGQRVAAVFPPLAAARWRPTSLQRLLARLER